MEVAPDSLHSAARCLELFSVNGFTVFSEDFAPMEKIRLGMELMLMGGEEMVSNQTELLECFTYVHLS